MKYGATGQGNRKDKTFLKRKKNDMKSREMIAKSIHKTKKCKCCNGTHRKVEK